MQLWTWIYVFNYIHSNHSSKYISPHDYMPVLHIIFIFLFIIYEYNLEFYEINPKCFTSSIGKALGRQTWKNGDRSILSSRTHFNFICDNSEIMHGETPSSCQAFLMKMHWKTFSSHQMFSRRCFEKHLVAAKCF